MHPYLTELIATERIRDLHRTLPRPRPERASERSASILIRPAAAADQAAVEKLAELEERPTPEGPLLVAELDGELAAAIPLAGGLPVADPFRPTTDLIGMLELRAQQLAA